MNACLQCLIPIVSLRDYYLGCEFNKYFNTKTMSNSNDYCRKLGEFYSEVYKAIPDSGEYLNPTMLKNLIRKKFYPMMQHDVHEFLMHILSQLQDEETPANIKKFDGDVTKQNKDRTIP
jgi:ubiquitin C-terminal hydrolase